MAEALLWEGREGMHVSCLNFKPRSVTMSRGPHVAVRIFGILSVEKISGLTIKILN